MPRKSIKKSEIKIHKLHGDSLVDGKVMRARGQDRMTKIILTTVGIGLFAGSAVLGYFLYYTPFAPEPDYAGRIVVPQKQDNQVTASSTPSETVGAAESPKVIQYVTILPTPVGYLNVRKGPGTNYGKTGQVKPGERYELIVADEQKGWYEIKLTSGSTGWVSRQYSEIK